MVTTLLTSRNKIIWAICGLLWMLWLGPGIPVAAAQTASVAPVQGVSTQEPNVHGVWFADGDRQRPCSINQNNGYLSLIDEKGQVSGGRIAGPGLIEAYGGLGQISPDGMRIDWAFGVSWVRSPTHQQKKAVSNAIDISGRWYAMGNARKRCRITQSGDVIQTIDETGQVWPGKINGQTLEGIGKRGSLTMNGSRIDWADNTFWTRRPQKKSSQVKAPEKPSPPVAPSAAEPSVTPSAASESPASAAANLFQPSYPPRAQDSPPPSVATSQPAPQTSSPTTRPPAQPTPPTPAAASAPVPAIPPTAPSTPPAAQQVWPHLKGSWYAYGDPGRVCKIEQHGQDLVFINEAGNRSTGRFLNEHTVDSNGFKGVLSQDFSRIEWANHTWWVR